MDDLVGYDEIQPDEIIQAETTDSETLALGVYYPKDNVCPHTLVLLHGGGAHMMSGYNYLADQLRTRFGMLVVTPDLRGHGHSSGLRGFAPSPEMVWSDIDIVIEKARQLSPTNRLHLCGHSSGAGALLNWAAQKSNIEIEKCTLTLLAPFLNERSNHTKRDKEEADRRIKFARVNIFVFIFYFASLKLMASRWPAVIFDYPKQKAKDLDLVCSYSPAMAIAVTPKESRKQLTDLSCSTFVLCPEDDELFSNKLSNELEASIDNSQIQFSTISGGHLSCLFSCADMMVKHLGLAQIEPEGA